jgi:hypothetical protein
MKIETTKIFSCFFLCKSDKFFIAMINSQMESSFCSKYCIVICVNKPYRKLMGQLRKDNAKTKATMDTRHETKTVDIGHNTTQKTKKISNADPTKKK